MPIWGQNYIEQFLDIGLPSLMAPGNLPAMAERCDCEFVFLTLEGDEEVFAEHPAFQSLTRLIPINFEFIDDLVVDGNYAVTITYAYLRSVRAEGDAMLQTHFLFLVSDYVVADGSLRALTERILDGHSAIVSGNFQMCEETTAALLASKRSGDGVVLAVQPRNLMSIALTNLHPVTLASTYNQPLFHNSHANRLFWRVDETTLVGRFFLMHMLCIRPERTEFEIGASCDYSFIPEMCPSGNTVAIEDSDEFLIVEMQGTDHEQHFVKNGPYDDDPLAQHLSEWTTAGHRANSRFCMTFHSAELPANMENVKAVSEQTISALLRRMSPSPKPHRGHPYWIGAVAAWEYLRRRSARQYDVDFLTTLRFYRPDPVLKFLRRVFWRVFGTAPNVRPWHHYWRDYSRAVKSLRGHLDQADNKVLYLSERSNEFSRWLGEHPDTVELLQTTRFLRRHAKDMEAGNERYDACFCYLNRDEFWRTDAVLIAARRLLRPGGKIYLFSLNGSYIHFGDNFPALIRMLYLAVLGSGFHVDYNQILGGNFRRMIGLLLHQCNRLVSARPILSLPLVLPLLALAYSSVAVSNITQRGNQPDSGAVTSVFLELSTP